MITREMPVVEPPSRARYVIVFRSRLREGIEAAYNARAEQMYTIVSQMPGLLSAKDYTADDGERVSIIEFDSAEHLRAWREHPDHLRAQLEGRERFYASYDITICVVERAAHFDAATGAWTRSPW